MTDGSCEVADPVMVSESYLPHEEVLPSMDDVDRAILHECGYREGMPAFDMIFENVVADSDDEKIFTFDLHRSYGLSASVDEILKDESFNDFCHRLFGDEFTEGVMKLVGDEVGKRLSKLAKGETFYYVDFFRELLLTVGGEGADAALEFDDPAFGKMPNVTRLY